MPALRQIQANDTDAILSAISEDGGCIALNLLDHALCDKLLQDFGKHLDDMPWGTDELGYRDDFYGRQTKRLHGLFSKSNRMVEVLTRRPLLEVARKMFVESGLSKDIRLSNTELMVLNSDQDVQVFHADAASWKRAQKLDSEEILVSANIALTDFRESNGATRVVPGSHLWPSFREPEDDEICYAEMPKGAALIYSGNVLHSGGANREAAPRVGLYLGYVVSWLRPLENQLITNRPDDVLSLSDEARCLLDVSPGGFTVFA
jgi:ectoine hydroxylase-related dioxygenase (phytanoyl-CoA dioxygenase family)